MDSDVAAPQQEVLGRILSTHASTCRSSMATIFTVCPPPPRLQPPDTRRRSEEAGRARKEEDEFPPLQDITDESVDAVLCSFCSR